MVISQFLYLQDLSMLMLVKFQPTIMAIFTFDGKIKLKKE